MTTPEHKLHRSNRDRGITLIELLVVIFITLLITAIAIPVMIPSVAERRLRETSRVVTSHIQGARTRAIQTGRNFGILIEPQANLTGAAVTLAYMADAEPWSGDFGDSQVHVVGGFPQFVDGYFYGYIDNFIDSLGAARTETGWKGIIRPGDQIRFAQGPLLQLLSGEPFVDLNANGTYESATETYQELNGDSSYNGPNLFKGTINNDPSAVPHWTVQSSNGPVVSTGFNDLDMPQNGTYNTPPDTLRGLPFTIYRQPTKTAAHPLQLPNAMVIDLQFSGVPANGVSFNGVGPVTILFTSTGALSRIYFFQNNRMQSFSPAGPIYLLIGKTENVGTTANYQDLTSFWVTIHPQTGLVGSYSIPGPEPFVDANSNNQFDASESYTDSNGNGAYDGSERFTDSNGNGKYDAGEPFTDSNGDGAWNFITLSYSHYLADAALTLSGR